MNDTPASSINCRHSVQDNEAFNFAGGSLTSNVSESLIVRVRYPGGKERTFKYLSNELVAFLNDDGSKWVRTSISHWEIQDRYGTIVQEFSGTVDVGPRGNLTLTDKHGSYPVVE
jgi:hypothetical protein